MTWRTDAAVDRLDEVCRAIADATRREILHALMQGELPAGEIAARFPITDASISHHLRVLKAAGLVTATRDGRNIIYALNQEVVQRFLSELLDFFEAPAVAGASQRAGIVSTSPG